MMEAKNTTYKLTGLDWMPEVPEHWEVRRLKNVAKVVLGKMLCNEDKGGYSLKPYLKSKNIGRDEIIIVDVDEMWFSPTEMDTYRIREKDLLVSEGGEVGKTCIWNNELDECYIQNSVHKVTCNEDCLPEYYLFWMRMLGYVGYFKSIVNQVSIAHLTREKIVTVICLHPPLPEQAAIVQYIKTQEEKINRFIEKKQRFIELLKEQRQSVVEAVIKNGTTSKVELKETGINWLGKIPKHWGICRLKDCGTYKSGDNITSEQIELIGEYPVYGGNGLRGYFDHYTHDGSFALIGRQGALCGNINYAHGKFWASEHAVVVTLKEGIELFWFGETLKVMNLNQYSQSAAQPGISVDRIRALHMPFPPLEEQQQIVAHIKTETATIDKAIGKAEREIELIREYKEAMIGEAVMGKKNLTLHINN